MNEMERLAEQISETVRHELRGYAKGSANWETVTDVFAYGIAEDLGNALGWDETQVAEYIVKTLGKDPRY